MFEFYEKHKILILNSKNELALNYDDEEWKEKTLENFKKIDFIQSNITFTNVSNSSVLVV